MSDISLSFLYAMRQNNHDVDLTHDGCQFTSKKTRKLFEIFKLGYFAGERG